MYKKILVPIALDHRPNTAAALNVARFLKDNDGEIVAVHAIEPIPGYVTNSIPAEIMDNRDQEIMASLTAELGGVKDVKLNLIHGSAGRAIIEYAGSQETDCIVIASHEPGIQDYFLGSTAGRVVRHAKCAVHVVR